MPNKSMQLDKTIDFIVYALPHWLLSGINVFIFNCQRLANTLKMSCTLLIIVVGTRNW